MRETRVKRKKKTSWTDSHRMCTGKKPASKEGDVPTRPSIGELRKSKNTGTCRSSIEPNTENKKSIYKRVSKRTETGHPQPKGKNGDR